MNSNQPIQPTNQSTNQSETKIRAVSTSRLSSFNMCVYLVEILDRCPLLSLPKPPPSLSTCRVPDFRMDVLESGFHSADWVAFQRASPEDTAANVRKIPEHMTTILSFFFLPSQKYLQVLFSESSIYIILSSDQKQWPLPHPLSLSLPLHRKSRDFSIFPHSQRTFPFFFQPPTLNVLPLAVFLSLAAPSSASGLARRSTCRKSAVRRRMRLWM